MTLLIIAIILILVGLAGIFLPILPGTPIAWIGYFVYDYGTDFQVLPRYSSLAFFVLMVLSVVLDFILPIWGAKKYNASNQGLIGAGIGLVLGMLIFNVIGVIIGPLVGAIIGELIAGKENQAFRSGFGVFIGFMISMISRLILVLIMIGFFVFALI